MTYRDDYTPEEVAKMHDIPIELVINLLENGFMAGDKIKGVWHVHKSLAAVPRSNFDDLPLHYK
jgi:hypothetical protein